ncbi:group I intron-associated PD-(D/E)XK endonuclease [Halosimplex pelagicum]|uniref:PD(D/E)XK endonuclease domain-containing protein n=1 Tax=Halosimplex pelagicum TaxID=869886 RepID=A0A7D5P9M5_9EURY|nr:group I intron-associated PD-(D/E)XK endonuclease [Halosimplex pelagicum]QLH80578.1 hypothetical protein HZS54_02545 [Halosimplex pelagicum]
MKSHERGDATEAAVIAELKRRCLSVSIPFGDNERYDIVVATPDDRLLRVQIKTGWIRDGTIEFHGKSQHTNSTGNTYTNYEGDVDYFVVYVPDLDSMYLIGESEFGTGMQLRVDDPEQSHETIHWAEEYRFEERWPPRPDGSATADDRPTVERVSEYLRQRDVDFARAVTISEYDLLVDTAETVVRLGVETGWVEDGRIRFHPNSSTDRDSIDWFLVYCAETSQAYLVDPDEFDTSISLRVDDPDTEMPSINWAKEYEFENRWPH